MVFKMKFFAEIMRNALVPVFWCLKFVIFFLYFFSVRKSTSANVLKEKNWPKLPKRVARTWIKLNSLSENPVSNLRFYWTLKEW